MPSACSLEMICEPNISNEKYFEYLITALSSIDEEDGDCDKKEAMMKVIARCANKVLNFAKEKKGNLKSEPEFVLLANNLVKELKKTDDVDYTMKNTLSSDLYKRSLLRVALVRLKTWLSATPLQQSEFRNCLVAEIERLEHLVSEIRESGTESRDLILLDDVKLYSTVVCCLEPPYSSKWVSDIQTAITKYKNNITQSDPPQEVPKTPETELPQTPTNATFQTPTSNYPLRAPVSATLMSDPLSRLASFKEFAVNGKKCNPRSLSQAGFYHTHENNKNTTTCYSCKLVVTWGSDDVDPMKEHIRLIEIPPDGVMRKCTFLSEGDISSRIADVNIIPDEKFSSADALLTDSGQVRKSVVFNNSKRRLLFDSLDTSGSGFVDPSKCREMWMAFETFGCPQDGGDVCRMLDKFSSYDGNVNPGLTFDEFSVLLMQRAKV